MLFIHAWILLFSSIDSIPDRTIDELYYKLAVDFQRVSPSAFVFTVPVDAYRMNMSAVRVTGSQALFINTSGPRSSQSIPWGVIGVNMKYTVFAYKFLNDLTNVCTIYP